MYENFSVEWSLDEKTGGTQAAATKENWQEAVDEFYENETKKQPEQNQPEQPVATQNDKKSAEKKDTVATSTITVIVNGRTVTLRGKSSYYFVDVLDFYPFDVSTAHGQTVVTQINGEKADFSQPVKAGDVIDLYWK